MLASILHGTKLLHVVGDVVVDSLLCELAPHPEERYAHFKQVGG